jgi:hypothetical protein
MNDRELFGQGFAEKIANASGIGDLLALTSNISNDDRFLREKEDLIVTAAIPMVGNTGDVCRMVEALKLKSPINNLIAGCVAREGFIQRLQDYYILLVRIQEGPKEDVAREALHKALEPLLNFENATLFDLCEMATKTNGFPRIKNGLDQIERAIIEAAGPLLMTSIKDVVSLIKAFDNPCAHNEVIIRYAAEKLGMLSISDGNDLMRFIDPNDAKSHKEAMLAIFHGAETQLKPRKQDELGDLQNKACLIPLGIAEKGSVIDNQLLDAAMKVFEEILKRSRGIDTETIAGIAESLPTPSARHMLLLTYIEKRGVKSAGELKKLSEAILGNHDLGGRVKIALIQSADENKIEVDVEEILDAGSNGHSEIDAVVIVHSGGTPFGLPGRPAGVGGVGMEGLGGLVMMQMMSSGNRVCGNDGRCPIVGSHRP